MSIRTKILTFLVILFFVFLLMDYALARFLFMPSLRRMEKREAQKDAERCLSALEREIKHLDVFTWDWAAWDDSYDYVKTGEPSYAEANLLPATFFDNDLNAIYIYDEENNLVWGQSWDIHKKKRMIIPELSRNYMGRDHPLLREKEPGESVAGVMLTSRGPLMVSSRPITTSEGEGPVRGVFIMARVIDEDLLESLREQTQVHFTVWPVKDEKTPRQFKKYMDSTSPAGGFPMEIHDRRNMRVYAPFPGIDGATALMVRVNRKRDAMVKGRAAMGVALIFTIATGFLTLLVLNFYFNRVVVNPLIELTQYVKAVGRGERPEKASDLRRRDDEIGLLATEFEDMMEQLSAVQKKLLNQSYKMGMAEMASGVLHNLRNSLWPMIGRMQALSAELRDFPMDRMTRAWKELREGAENPAREKDLRAYLDVAIAEGERLYSRFQNELQELTERSRRIEEIFIHEEDWRGGEKILERFSLDEAVYDAITLVPGELRKDAAIRVDPSLAQLGEVHSGRIPLMQIFANLFINAAESIKASDNAAGEIYVTGERKESKGRVWAHIRVCDNGVGLSEAELDRVFTRGYTTKGRGSSGIGLHWCANAVASWNGRIYAESDGRGKGASFHLILPMNAGDVDLNAKER